MVASSALEGLYLLLLASGYGRAAMSFVYPIARGSAPVFVLAFGVIVLGTIVSTGAALGVLLVAGGIILVRGLRGVPRASDLALALGVGGCIAGYTLVDKHGIAHASPIPYIETVFAATTILYLLGVSSVRGAAALRAALGPRTVLAGAGFVGSYALVLVALKHAPAASVAAVRESSVVIATAILALSGRERVMPERFIGALSVFAGIALISLG
jgi:uncharacterized membrane protein